jgi:putative ABC transport system permease protein
VRKTFGSGRVALMMQFVGEAIVLTTAATILGLALLSMLLPFFNDLVERQLHFHIIHDVLTIPILLIFIITVGLIAGIYPAFYLSSFSPNAVLKSIHRIDNGKGILRSGLVIIQFSIAIALVIGTIVIQNQLAFIMNKDLGFRKDHMIQMSIGGALGGHLETFKTQLSKNPDVLGITNSSRMFSSGIPGTGFLYNKRSGTDPFLCQFLDVDYDFQTTFGFEMASGRFFSSDFPSDSNAVVINEAAARAMTTEDPVGKDLISLDAREEGRAYQIIGVMKDINYESLHREVRPLVVHISAPRQIANMLTIRISSSNIPATLAFIEKEWKKLAREDQVFNYAFLDETLSNLYKTDQKTRVVISIFSALAVFIACIGLFGLAAFITEQRTKEIGIRKVLGASVPGIVLSLSGEFAIWVGLANIMAWPVAYFAMQRWLENFAFRTELNLKPFLIAGVLTLIIALTTVAIHTIRAARNNPVKSLKYE